MGRHNATDVIFSGVPETLTSFELYRIVRSRNEDVVDAQVVQREDGDFYGYARFDEPDIARAFVKANSEMEIGEAIVTCLQFGEGGKWTCRICGTWNYEGRPACHQCCTARGCADEKRSAVLADGNFNDGSKDEGESATSFLLLRGLDGELNGERVYEMLTTDNIAPKRVLLVHNIDGRFLGFGFVEYNSTSEAVRALLVLEKSVQFAKCVASYINLGVFQPDLANSENPQFKTVAGMPMKYWDPRCSLTEFVAPEKQSSEPTSNDDHHNKRQKLKSFSIRKPKAVVEETVDSFADLHNLACVLCYRQFDSPHHLKEHERLSTLHQQNLQSPELVQKASRIIKKLKSHNSYA